MAMPLYDERPLVDSRFLLERNLGVGAVGVVDLATDLLTGRMVALKKARPDRAGPVGEMLFAVESRALKAVSHPNVAGFVASGLANGLPYLAMEYVDGPCMQDLDIHGLHSLRTLLELSKQVCDGLEALHLKGIVHRDVKPNNVGTTGSHGMPIAKILDLGYAQMKGSADIAVDNNCLVGTGRYMAPEQTLRGKAVDRRADLFSLGVVMYEAISGIPPIPSQEDSESQFRLQRECDPIDIRLLSPDLDVHIARLVMRALEKDPSDRFQSAKEMGKAISSCL